MVGKRGVSQEYLAFKAVELLGDGEWHSYETVISELTKLVPPGVAVRRNEKDRAGNEKQRTGRVTERMIPLPPGQAIRSGARAIVRDFLYNRRVFEVDKRYPPGRRPDGVVSDQYIRLVGTPRALTYSVGGETRLDRRRRRENRINALERQLATVRAFLVEIGYEEDADRLIPKEEEGEA